MIAARYCRKSTDERDVDTGAKKADEAKSIPRQRDHGRLFGQSRGWVVDDRYCYEDENVSGAEFEKRSGLQCLLKALTPKPPFQILIISEFSRLGRDTIKTLSVLQQILDAGVKVFSYLDQREINLDEMGEITSFMQSWGATFERRKARDRATDTSLRKARAGHVTGGRTFGYTNIKVDGHKDRVINEGEATVVRQIFTLFSEGKGLKKLAGELNVSGCIPPRPSKSGPPGWSPSTIKAILCRSIYAGEITWGKTRKRNAAGRRQTSKRPASEWITTTRPDLQIVDPELFKKVQDILADNALAYLRAPDGKLRGRPPGSSPNKEVYVLTGLGRCAVCNGSMAVRTSFTKGARTAYLECLTRRTKGSQICSNSLVVPLKAAQEAVLHTLDAELLRPDRILRVVDRVIAQMTPDPTHLAAERARLKSEVSKVERELARLARLAVGDDPPVTLVHEMKVRESALAGLRTSVSQLDGREALATVDHSTLEAKVQAKLAEYADLKTRHPAAARSLLKKVIQGPIQFIPVTGPDHRYYKLEWTGYLGGLLTAELAALTPGQKVDAHQSDDFIGGGPNGTHSNLHDSSA